jgi:hypothetical protein
MNNDQPNAHDFLTVGDLDNFTDKVDSVINGEQTDSPELSINQDEETESVPYDSTKFESIAAQPTDLDENTLYQIADIFDKKTHLNGEDLTVNQGKSPNTVDKIMSSIAVIYVNEIEGGMPVAAAILIDPTIENYKGIIPSDYYEMQSGTSLENRLQQEYFAILPEKVGLGISDELRRLITTVSPETFVVVQENDTETIAGLQSNGHKLVSTFDTEWEPVPVQLWLNQ